MDGNNGKTRENGANAWFALASMLALWAFHWLARYRFFHLHHIKGFCTALAGFGTAALLIAAVSRAKLVMAGASCGYIIGFAAGMLIKSYSIDPSGAKTSNGWKIWVLTYLAIVVLSVLATAVRSRMKTMTLARAVVGVLCAHGFLMCAALIFLWQLHWVARGLLFDMRAYGDSFHTVLAFLGSAAIVAAALFKRRILMLGALAGFALDALGGILWRGAIGPNAPAGALPYAAVMLQLAVVALTAWAWARAQKNKPVA